MDLIYNRPVYLMAKPAGPMCNMACKYCYYLDKAKLFDQKKTMMDDATLEEYIRKYIAAQPAGNVQFTWHGGEATIRPLEFYQKAMDLQKRYGTGMHIENCLQTNGMLLTDKWCQFLKKNNWLVGLSIDGPKDFHDEYRRMRDGRPTHARVMQAVRMLQRHGVEWNAMAVVNDYNADYPEEFYDFFKQIGCRYLQFTPIVEVIDGKLTPESVTPEQWGDFLCRVFDRWVKTDVGTIFVQIFDATLANWAGVEPGLCTMARTCGHAAVMEHNGDVYSCDHFVAPEHKLGNIRTHTLVEMMMSDQQQKFGADKFDSLPTQCRQCQWLKLCNGECPKNRICQTADGQPGLNYLCAGYKKFFQHTERAMRFMKAELDAQRAPANIMLHPELYR